MQIFVMSCSPKKETSLTYNSCRFLEKMFPDDVFHFQFTTDGTFPDEFVDEFKSADLILINSSIFHFSVHSLTYAMFKDMKTKLGDALKGKPMTLFSTSGKNGEYNAHDLVRRFAESVGA